MLVCSAGLSLSMASLVMAQDTQQSPGPTNPVPPPAQTKPGSDLVANPTDEECKRGWDAGMKWTKDQFDQLCATMRAAK